MTSRRRAVVARRGRMMDRACEVLRAYEVRDALETVHLSAGGLTEPAARAASRRDDIALDFPSVSEMVDQIGHGLVESTAPCIARVRLTWRQACRGAHVPLEIPVRCTCLVCGGRGEIWDDACSMCAGSGTERQHHLVRLSLPTGVGPNARFWFTINPPYAAETSVDVRVTIV
ncbi:MAG: hypothetical protein QF634_10950 [Vicinamibacterales bacterium]|nr:hypothetical protein [Vicinamibacterales bacterium]